MKDQPENNLTLLTPRKVTLPQQKIQKSFIQFKKLDSDQCYIPKLRNITKANQVSLYYIYMTNCLQQMGNLDQISEQKSKNNEPKDVQIITQVKKKGVKDFTMCIKRNVDSKPLQANSVLIGTTHFKSSRILNYFELQLLQSPSDSAPAFCFGITNDQQHSGKNKNEISFSFSFNKEGHLEVYRNSFKIEQILNFNLKINDKIGCGFIYHSRQIFLVLNGKIILYKFKLYIPDHAQQKQKPAKLKTINEVVDEYNFKFYPFISIQSKKITLQAVFQNSHANFCFPYQQEIEKLEYKLTEEQMAKEAQTHEESMYGLILNYFKYHGLQKSSLIFEEQMMKRSMKFYPQNEPIRNKLDYAKKHQIIIQRGKQKKIRKGNKKHCCYWQRSARRNTQQQEYQFDEFEQEQIRSNDEENDSKEHSDSSDNDQNQQFHRFRKSCVISRRSMKSIEHEKNDQGAEKKKLMDQQSSLRLNMKKMERKVQELKRSQQEKFKGERIQIMRSIQEGKLEQAFKLFSKSYKKILLKSKHLEVFFKAHIFLKYYHQQGIQKALEYAKKEHRMFTQFESYLMPFFNSKSLSCPNQKECQYRPLREILFLICPENKLEFNLERQFLVFAQFVGEIICEDSGFFGNSKLELVLSHYMAVEKKVDELDLSIGGIDLQKMDLI